MATLVFFLEEQSAEEMLRGLLPRLISENIETRFITFEGKQDLDKQLERKLRGWKAPDSFFVVLRDQDSADCKSLKKRLVTQCRNAGRPTTLIRIACRELESWYFGDFEAVKRALELPNIKDPHNKERFREPDTLINAARELEELTNGAYQKVLGSRMIGPQLSLTENRSPSFRTFVAGIRRLVEAINVRSQKPEE